MRKLTFTAPNGDDIELAATFAASVELAEKVADPMHMHRQAVASATLGPSYQAKFAFTVSNVAKIMHIGAKHAGSKMTLSEMNDLAFEIGAFNAQALAEQYVLLFLQGGEVKLKPSEGKEPSGE
jgi:ABC-type hemin transport system ATPase subunit